MTPMRKAIAEHMVLSRRTSAHVQTVFEVDMTSVVAVHERYKDEFERREGFKLTYTPFFVKALVDTVRDHPIMNISVSGEQIVYQEADQCRHRGCAGHGAHRAGSQGCALEVFYRPWRMPSGMLPSAPARRSLRPRMSSREPLRSPIPASSARCSARRSSTSRRWQSSTWAPWKSGRLSSTMRSRSAPWSTWCCRLITGW